MADEHKVGDEIPANCELIEVHVTELRLLFNPIDPSPPGERDLDAKAEEFIVSWARSLRRDAALALLVEVDKPDVRAEAETVGDATHEFFRQRSLSASRRLSQLFPGRPDQLSRSRRTASVEYADSCLELLPTR